MDCRTTDTDIHWSRDQKDTPSAGSSHTTASVSHLRQLRRAIAELEKEIVVQKRHIEELRGAIVALMEPDMPRILRTSGGIMVLDNEK